MDGGRKMKVPCCCCSVCQNRYSEEDRVALLLQCGHGFCKECLSNMFSASQETTLVCPRCRHVSVGGNSVHALRNNYAVLALLHSPSSAAMPSNFDDKDDEDEDEDEGGNEEENEAERCSRGSHASSFGTCGRVIELGVHQNVELVKKIGEGRRAGAETWSAVIKSSAVAGKCRHRVTVKKVEVGEGVEVEWVQAQLENLRRASMRCTSVCTFHGVVKVDGCLGLVMFTYCGSVQSEMQQNEGRLALEQILRYGADIARGVAELHAAGVVCMNIKPSNLLLDSSGRAVVSDYGLASILRKPSCRKAKTECDSAKIHSCMDCIMLSPHYTAPEACDDAIRISAESDAWSFGCTLVEMCTGATPWAGLSAEEVYRAVEARKLPPHSASVVGVGIPRELWKMVGECLQFKPSRRPTFNAMLAIFIRHLQELPRTSPASPDNDYVQKPGSNVVEQSPPSDLEVFPANSSHLHRLVSEGNVIGVRDVLAKAAGADPTSQDAPDGRIALHTASMANDVQLVKIIARADVTETHQLEVVSDASDEKSLGEVVVRDRISHLPECIAQEILARLSLPEATRTSFLSRAWRHTWECRPSLSFDDSFWPKFKVVDGFGPSICRLMSAVSQVLYRQRGPLGCFTLSLPQLTQFPAGELCHFTFVADHLVAYLHGRSIRSLRCVGFGGELPYLILLLWNLERLELRMFRFTSPDISFQSFHLLSHLDLHSLTFPRASPVSITVDCPLLLTLTIRDCGDAMNRVHIFILAPNLGCFDFMGSFTVLWIKDAPNLRNMTIYRAASFDSVRDPKNDEPTDLMKLFDSCTELERLSMSYSHLLERRLVLVEMNSILKRLRRLSLSDVSLNDGQLGFFLGLTSYWTDLEVLQLTMRNDVEQATGTEDWFGNPTPNRNLKLRRVEIHKFMGTEVQMKFVRWLVGTMPELHTIHIQLEAGSRTSNEIEEDIDGLEKASRGVRIYFA